MSKSSPDAPENSPSAEGNAAANPVPLTKNETPAPLATALSFLHQARQDLNRRGAALDNLQKDWDAEQERYAALFNTIPDGFFLTDPLGIIRDASRVAAALLHIPPPQLPGKPLINFVALEDRPNLRRSLLSLQSAADAPPEQITEFVRVTPRHAPVFEALVRISPVFSADDQLNGFQWLLCDISERVRAETERYRLLVDAVEDYAVFLINDDGRITSWNRGAEKTFGWRERDVLGQTYAFLFPPDQAFMADEEMTVARTSGRYLEEGWMMGRDEKRFWTQGVLLALPSGGNNAATSGDNHRAGFAKILRDMTDKQREAEELRMREARMRLALDAARAASWEWNLETDAVIWSPELFTLSGMDFQTDIPSIEMWIRSIHPDDRADARQKVAESLGNNIPLAFEYRPAPELPSTAQWLLSLAQPVSDVRGRVVRVVGVIQDISERKNAEVELEDRVIERTRELAQAGERLVKETTARHVLIQKIVTAQEDERRRISRELHDTMGQHLTAFSLSLRVLEDTYPPDSQGRPLLTRLREISHELSRDLHQMAVDLRPTAIDDLGIADALQSYVENWTERVGIKAEFGASGFDHKNGEKHAALSGVVETTLYRIAQEALNNIARHSGATRADVTLSRYGDTVVLVIEDNGRGFDAERILHPAPSVRIPPTRDKENEEADRQPSGRLGVLGMAERAQTVGGTFTMESEPGGGGTSIFVRVPLMAGG